MTILGFSGADGRLIWNMFKMGIRDRYLGSTLGGLWAILNPILLMTVYTFVFGFVLKAKAPGAETTLSYAIWLIVGMGPWLATSEAVVAATGSVVSSSSMVKNLAFKVEVLTVAQVLTSLVPLLVTIAFVLILMASTGTLPALGLVYLLPLVAVHYVMLIGIGLGFATFNVFLRDFGLVLPNLLTMFLFASPIFYPLESMPAPVARFSAYNPVYVLVKSYREILLSGQAPSLVDMAYLFASAVVVMIMGLYVFRRFKPYFESFM